ncbi:MAG TPA: SRPBCC family protein [Chloroflexota bacterium]|nr:SRPBCC family protein [Chloroflexota bacterium]
MRDFERSTTVAIGPDEAYRFLAEPANLPRYVATMTRAQPEEGDRLWVAAEVQGRHEEGNVRFHADVSRRRLEWGAGGPAQYGGWLQVAAGDGGASVTIHLHVEHDEDEAEINRALDETVTNINRLLSTT